MLKGTFYRMNLKTNKIKNKIFAQLLSFPKKVQCNICNWSGSHFLSDKWHKNINCPRCFSGIRHRLFFAAMQNIRDYYFCTFIQGKKILHFAPEKIILTNINKKAAIYKTADYLRTDCDFNVDIANMTSIKNESFNVVIVLDVLEHVKSYNNALKEIHRILMPSGHAIFTVPQQDGLAITFEDPKITEPAERTKYYGQFDHLRIFGDDFKNIIEKNGYKVVVVDESSFPDAIVAKNVLFPPEISKNLLATNHRRVFFSQKI
jgi:SAM-dependent methyltransferase